MKRRTRILLGVAAALVLLGASYAAWVASRQNSPSGTIEFRHVSAATHSVLLNDSSVQALPAPIQAALLRSEREGSGVATITPAMFNAFDAQVGWSREQARYGSVFVQYHGEFYETLYASR